ncbi:MAG: hypothetical protein ABJJ53_14280 [Sulfitobacter sp.]
MTDASLPLRDRMEAFAVSLAQGRTQGQAYKDAIPKGEAHSLAPTVLRVSGHRWASRSDVKLRVAYLRRQAAGEVESIPDQLTKANIIDLNNEVADLLRECYETSKAIGVTSQSKLEMLRKTLAQHLSRMALLSAENEAPAQGTDLDPMLNSIYTLGACTCRD